MRLTINPRAWQMLMRAARSRPDYEIGGFGRMRVDGTDLVVDDVLIPPQEVGAAHVDISVDELGWLAMELAERHEAPRQWALWWHSHAAMGTNPSATDYATLRMLAEQSQAGYAVGLVVNVRGDASAWACVKSPIANAYHDVSLQVRVDEYVDPEIAAYIDAQLQHVRVKKIEPVGRWLPAAPPSTRAEWAELLGLDDDDDIDAMLDQMLDL